jgi:hypothetical protein
MIDHEKDKHLDELLDSALAQYSSAEPRPGLETRILANVREAGATAASPQRSWRWLWAGAMAAVAVSLIVLLAGRHSQVAGPANNLVHAPQAPAQVPQPVESTASVTPSDTPKHRRKMPAPPLPETVALTLEHRPAVFPTPTGLSEQEKLLLSYYARTPREELIAQSHPDDPPIATDDQSNIAVPDLVFVPQKSSNTR